jgi:cobalt/nickel transport system permease protein
MLVAHVRGHRVRSEELDEYAKGTWLHGLDSRAKLAGVVAFVVATALLTDPMLLLASLGLSVAFAAMSQVPALHLAKAYVGALPFILIAALSVFLVSGYPRALEMLMRTSSCVLALLVLASATDTYDLFAGLRRLKVPAMITTLLMLTYKFILVLGEESARMTVARKARGFSGGRSLLDMRAMKTLGYSAGMTFVRSSGRAGSTYEALKSRGFDGEFRFRAPKGVGAPEAAFIAWFAVTAAVLIVFQVGVLA